MNKNSMQPISGMEDLISIQNIQPESKFSQSVTPKVIPTACSIISTNHTHIKVITHQALMGAFSDMTPENMAMQ
jgi:hypothetical protein